jgi:hypothetical protein
MMTPERIAELRDWLEDNTGYGIDSGDAVEIVAECLAEIKRLRAIVDGPEIKDFLVAAEKEAKYQRAQWGDGHDAGKVLSDWYWTLGYLGGKALYALLADDKEKGLHHIITTAALCANWHRAIVQQGAASTRQKAGKANEIERPPGRLRWIPVTERLPPAQESVLVKFHYQPSMPALMYRWGDQWWHDPNHNEPDRNITAWMPLPPDEEGEKK